MMLSIVSGQTVNAFSRVIQRKEFLLICLLLVFIAADQCEIGRFGADCLHECHCEDVSTCDNITGECGTGCGQGWDGPTCQRKNIALHRPTRQSTTAFKGESGQAVDGHTCPFYDRSENKFSCTHTKVISKVMPYWMVDLEGLPEIYYMRIYNRDDLKQKFSYRLLDFQVYVSNTTKFMNSQRCYAHDTSRFLSHKFTCASPVHARYVTVRLSSKKEPLSICEFQVFNCAPMWFGEFCEQECNCLNQTEVCHQFTGHCTSGCPEGKYGPNCKEVVPEVISTETSTKVDVTTSFTEMMNETSPQRYTNDKDPSSEHWITVLAMLFGIAVIIIGFMSFILAKRTQILKRLPVLRL